MKMSLETQKNCCFTVVFTFKVLNSQNVEDYFYMQMLQNCLKESGTTAHIHRAIPISSSFTLFNTMLCNSIEKLDIHYLEYCNLQLKLS